MLQLNEPEYDGHVFERVVRGEFHSSRLLHLSLSCEPGGACWDMIKRVWCQLHTPELWAHLPPTECTLSDALRVSLRPAAVLYKTVIAVYRNLPFRLLQLLQSPHLAPEFETMAKTDLCLQDSYSRALFQRYPTAKDMVGMEATLELRTLSMLAKGNSFDVERLHSAFARRSRTRPHSHTPELADVALWRMGWAAPAFVSIDVEEPAQLKSDRPEMSPASAFTLLLLLVLALACCGR